MNHFSAQTQRLLQLALAEDIGRGDVTSNLLIPASAKGAAVVVSREAGIFSGEAVARELAGIADPRLRLKFFVKDGGKFSKGRKILALEGSVRSILKLERTLLNFLGHLSGIATKTSRFVRCAKKFRAAVFDTRKTMPLWRGLEKDAVRAGGGKNHRRGLYDEIFVKENHRPHGDLGKLKRFAGKFVIEVRDALELKQALRLRARVILFDNFSPERLRRAVRAARKVNPKIILEASGGITEENIGRYAAAGVDRISVGSLTHSAKAVDFALCLHSN